MSEAFDPYRKWLGIPPKDQPPNHYRLLAIELFEDDPDVIEAAADQRMAHVRTYQTGHNSALSQKILNELSAARLCLLDPKKKSVYDDMLRQASGPIRAEPDPKREDAAEVIPLGEVNIAATSIERGPSLWKASAAARPPSKRGSGIAIASVAGALLIGAVTWMVLWPDDASVVTSKPIKGLPVEGATKSDSRSVTSQGDKAPKKKTVSSRTLPRKEQPALSLVADANHRPQIPGVVAERIVLWNQHNGGRRDRGTRECILSLWRDGSEVWRQDGIAVPWSPDAEQNVAVTIPPERFDRLRVEITKWEQSGGGLAEIEVFRGDRNLALGCPATSAGDLDHRFVAGKLTDGIANSFYDGSWLLPEKTPGWAEVDLAFAEPRACQDRPNSRSDAKHRLQVWHGSIKITASAPHFPPAPLPPCRPSVRFRKSARSSGSPSLETPLST